MDVDLSDGPVRVTLSRRNLTQLLAGLDRPLQEDPFLVRWCKVAEYEHGRDGIMLQVIAQEDADHYGDRLSGPGLDPLLEGTD
jgi:hypothetical protein